jgi:hypothetical protein
MIGDITEIAEIPPGTVITVAIACALLQQWDANGHKRVPLKHASHIIEEYAYRPDDD